MLNILHEKTPRSSFSTSGRSDLQRHSGAATSCTGSVTSLFRGNILIVFPSALIRMVAPVCAVPNSVAVSILRAAEVALLSGEVQDFPATAKVGDQAMLVRSAIRGL